MTCVGKHCCSEFEFFLVHLQRLDILRFKSLISTFWNVELRVLFGLAGNIAGGSAQLVYGQVTDQERETKREHTVPGIGVPRHRLQHG